MMNNVSEGLDDQDGENEDQPQFEILQDVAQLTYQAGTVMK